MTLTNGNALAGRLAKAAMDLNIPVWLSSPVSKLIVDEGRVVGATVIQEGSPVEIRVRRGVVLACGGFPFDVERRKQLFPHAPTGREHFTPSPPLNTGDGLRLAEAVGGKRAVTLLATGSEVAIALKARERLQADGIATAVVSMPCCELFDHQDVAYRSKVLGAQVVRVAIEAAVRFGWDRYLGERGDFVGMKGFGASGGAEQLYEYFNITAAEVVARVKRLVG